MARIGSGTEPEFIVVGSSRARFGSGPLEFGLRPRLLVVVEARTEVEKALERRPALRRDDELATAVGGKQPAFFLEGREECRAERAGEMRPALRPVDAGAKQWSPLFHERLQVDTELSEQGAAMIAEAQRAVVEADEGPALSRLGDRDAELAGEMVVARASEAQRTRGGRQRPLGRDARQDLDCLRDFGIGDAVVAVATFAPASEQPAFHELAQMRARSLRRDARVHREGFGAARATIHQRHDDRGARRLGQQRPPPMDSRAVVAHKRAILLPPRTEMLRSAPNRLPALRRAAGLRLVP